MNIEIKGLRPVAFALLVLVALPVLSVLLSGCGGTTVDAPAAKAASLEKEIDQRQEAQAARAGHRVNLGLDTMHTSQLTDKDLIEVRAQLHQSVMSNIAAMKMLHDMNEAEDLARLEAGLMDAPMTAEQRALRLAELRRAMEQIRENDRAKETEVKK